MSNGAWISRITVDLSHNSYTEWSLLHINSLGQPLGSVLQ